VYFHKLITNVEMWLDFRHHRNYKPRLTALLQEDRHWKMSLVLFQQSTYGTSIIYYENLASRDYLIRQLLVCVTFVIGIVQIYIVCAYWNYSVQAGSRFLRVMIGLLVCTVVTQCVHFMDNISDPVKHHEPEVLYTALLFATMDKTFLYQGIFVVSLRFSLQLLSTKTIDPTSATTKTAVRLLKTRLMAGV
jgi:hypothetical protein